MAGNDVVASHTSYSTLLTRVSLPYQMSVYRQYAKREWKDCQNQSISWIAAPTFNPSCKRARFMVYSRFKGLLLLRQVALVYSLPMAGAHVDQQVLT